MRAFLSAGILDKPQLVTCSWVVNHTVASMFVGVARQGWSNSQRTYYTCIMGLSHPYCANIDTCMVSKHFLRQPKKNIEPDSDSFSQYLQKVKHQIQHEILQGNSCTHTPQACEILSVINTSKDQSSRISKAFPFRFKTE